MGAGRDGVSPGTTLALKGLMGRFGPSAFGLVTLLAFLERKSRRSQLASLHSGATGLERASQVTNGPRVGLRGKTARILPQPRPSVWSADDGTNPS